MSNLSCPLIAVLLRTCLLASLSTLPAMAATLSDSPVVALGDPETLTGWSGIQNGADGAIVNLPGQAVYHLESESDWRRWYGLRFDVKLTGDQPVKLNVSIKPKSSARYPNSINVGMECVGAGWHTVTLPWNIFPMPQQSGVLMMNVRELVISAEASNSSTAVLGLRKVRLIRGEAVSIESVCYGQSVQAGHTAEYPVTLSNCTDQPQAIALTFERSGFEAMTPSVEPSTLTLSPGRSAKALVRVHVPERVPAGGHETQTLVAIANGSVSSSSRVEFITASRLEHPYVMHTAQGWNDIRAKIAQYEWARTSMNEYLTTADKWKIPEVANKVNPKKGDWLFRTEVEKGFIASAISYQVTGKKEYAQKVHDFMMNLSNPLNGYPVTLRACHQASVQEGSFFQFIAMVYDMTLPSGLYSDEDRRQIDQTMRLFIGPLVMHDGQISNWNVSYLCGQLYASLVLQDLVAAHHFLYSKGGIVDQMVQGTLDDGWWYECSISYNIWCATEFSQVAIAMRPWGVDLVNRSFVNAFRPNDEIKPQDELFGMSKARWGPIAHNSMSIKRMWDALPGMVDYRGMIFGLNDSATKPIAGPQIDIAYYLYRDPAYIPLIKNGGGKRDLLYGVPELPETDAEDRSSKSVYADNSGVAVLRSQTPGRPAQDRIQAVIHYGDHGWFHGHFDRTNLLHLSRYGRSFFNPEFIWYGYGNFMYKFYVQTSVSKNMVVVDRKMQEPVPSQRLLFHSGAMMQAAAVQTNARWSNPPYGGMEYDDYKGKTFSDKALSEGRSVPNPENPPKYGKVTDYTEPVLQRRLMIVADDYVLLADYVKSQNEHTFENLLQTKTFSGIQTLDGKILQPVRHTGQWIDNPLSSAQFVTNCDWYKQTGVVRGSFEFKWGPNADNEGTIPDASTDGSLKMDVFPVWPCESELMIAMPPESHSVNKVVEYAIRADGRTLKEGKTGAWILGQVDVDIPVDGVKELTLDAQTEGSRLQTLFWAQARIVTIDGREISVSELPLTYENTRKPAGNGKDYQGGPIIIAGVPYQQALPAESQNRKQPARVKIDLSGVRAARFKTVFGGDFPVGDETQRRRTFAVKSVGKEARFLTVIEPYENKSVIKSILPISADKLRVELTDGRMQEIQISNFEGSGNDIAVSITEFDGDKTLRSERTSL